MPAPAADPADTLDPEANLIARASRGEPAAFNLLFQRYHPMVHAFAYRLTLHAADADDLAQETFIRAARALGGGRGPTGNGTLRPWLFRIALNATRDRGRRHVRETSLTESFTAHRERESADRPVDFTALREALAGLPDPLRAAVTLVYLEEFSHAEAAAVLGCAETTVSWRIFLARRRLRKSLAGRFPTP